MNLRRSIPLVASIVVLALAFATSAWAQSPAQSAYSGVGADQISQATQPVSEVESTTTPTTASSTGSLPFTGLDLGAIVLAGAVLGGTGLMLRRWSKSSTN
jgi:hypothetical protein